MLGQEILLTIGEIMIELSTLDEINSFIERNPLTFLYFSRMNCGVCHALLPRVEEMLKNYPRIAFGYIKVDKVEETAGRFSIFTVPVLLFFVEGKESIREARFVHMDILKEKLNKIVQLYEEK